MTYEGPGDENEFEYDDADDLEGEEWKGEDYDKSDAEKWKGGADYRKNFKNEEYQSENREDEINQNERPGEVSDKSKKTPEEIERLKNRFDEVKEEIDESETILKGLRVKRDSISTEIDNRRGIHEVDLHQSKLSDINKTIYRLEDEIESLRIEMAETHNVLVDNE